MGNKNNTLKVYQNENGSLPLAAPLQNDTIWFTQADMVLFFDKNKTTISEHIRNIFKEQALMEEQVVRKFWVTATDGKSYQTNHNNLDVVISVGCRVKSQQGVKFCKWATKTLKQHLLQGYSLNQQRLTDNANEHEKALQLVKRAAALPLSA